MNVILGGSGFIGRNLLTNLSNSFGISIRNDHWKDKLYSLCPDTIINLVGKAHNHDGTATEQDYYYANFELTKEIFDVFINSTARLFIHISSLASVEELEDHNLIGEENLCKPISWYGISKRKAEEWLLNQEVPFGKKIIIIRPPMVHGPGDKGNLGLLYKFVSKGVPYPLSSFDNMRSFIAIENFIFFIKNIIEKQDKLKSIIYHIADDVPVSTKEIISIIESCTGKSIKNLAIPRCIVKWVARVGDFVPIPLNTKRLKKMTGNLVVSNNKIKQDLDIKCLPVSAKEGLKKTIESFVLVDALD